MADSVCGGMWEYSSHSPAEAKASRFRYVRPFTVGDFDHAMESNQAPFFQLVAREQLRVIAEMAQKPRELPQCFFGVCQNSLQIVDAVLS